VACSHCVVPLLFQTAVCMSGSHFSDLEVFSFRLIPSCFCLTDRSKETLYSQAPPRPQEFTHASWSRRHHLRRRRARTLSPRSFLASCILRCFFSGTGVCCRRLDSSPPFSVDFPFFWFTGSDAPGEGFDLPHRRTRTKTPPFGTPTVLQDFVVQTRCFFFFFQFA